MVKTKGGKLSMRILVGKLCELEPCESGDRRFHVTSEVKEVNVTDDAAVAVVKLDGEIKTIRKTEAIVTV